MGLKIIILLACIAVVPKIECALRSTEITIDDIIKETGCTEDQLQTAREKFEQCFSKYSMIDVEIQSVLESVLQEDTICEAEEGIDECFSSLIDLPCLKPEVSAHMKLVKNMEKAMLKFGCDNYKRVEQMLGISQCTKDRDYYLTEVQTCMNPITVIANSFELEFSEYQCWLLTSAFECIEKVYSTTCSKGAQKLVSEFLEAVMKETSCNDEVKYTGCSRLVLDRGSELFEACLEQNEEVDVIGDMDGFLNLPKKKVCEVSGLISNCWKKEVTELKCLKDEAKKDFNAVENMMVTPIKFFCNHYVEVKNASKAKCIKGLNLDKCMEPLAKFIGSTRVRLDEKTCKSISDSMECLRSKFKKCSKQPKKLISEVTREIYDASTCGVNGIHESTKLIILSGIFTIMAWFFRHK